MPRKTKTHHKTHHKTLKNIKNLNNVNCSKHLPGYISFEESLERKKNKKLISKSELIQFMNGRNTPEEKNQSVNDYYSYMCDPSIKELKLDEIPKYINPINKITLLQDKIYRQGIELIELNKSKHKNLYTFYQAAKTPISLDAAKKHINEFITHIDKLRVDTTNNNLWKLLAYFNKSRILGSMMPISFELLPNEKNITKFAIYLTNDWIIAYKQLELDDIHNRRAYDKYANAMFIDLLGANNGIYTDDIIQVNNELYDCISPSDTKYNYNIVYKNNEQKYNFNYEEFFKELGCTDESMPKFIIVKDLVYLEKACKLLLENWNTEKWRAFWIMSYSRQLARFTNKINEYEFNYYLKHNKGFNVDEPDDIRAFKLTILPFNKLLTTLYIDNYTDKNGIDYLTVLINDLKLEFYNILQSNKWMSASTKKEALLNIENLKIIVGKTFNPINDINIVYTNDSWENSYMASYERNKIILTLNETNVLNIPLTKWDKFPIEFAGNNIFDAKIKYNVQTNLIYIPAGYIQEPTMDLRSKGLIYNLANVGFDIATEMNKVVDFAGSHFNSHGMLLDKSWFSTSDATKYAQLNQNIVNEYIMLAKKDKENPIITGLEHNIVAFINGFHICHRFLQKYYNSIHLPYPTTKSKLNTFYSYFTNCHKELLLGSPILKTTPSLSFKHLVNLSLSKTLLFNYVLNIKKGDNMYIENKEIVW